MEECRNLATHHREFLTDCQKKAKEAFQSKKRGVAYYYAEIARLHKWKEDYYSNRASSCISEVHQLTQKNDDVLDLHHLHAEEALQSVDRFISRHAATLKDRAGTMKYKDIYIITGRGLHSAHGIPIIKFKVKTFLKTKGLK